MKPLIILFFISIFVTISVISCNNNPIISSHTGFRVDPRILQTDSTGRTLGGDTSDWCSTGTGYKLYPAYPNPSRGSVNVNFALPEEQIVKLYFKDSLNLETLLFEDTISAGYYTYQIISDDYMMRMNLLKLYMKAGTFTCSGDIQFY